MLKNVEEAMDISFCLMILPILNIIAMSTYIFAAIMTYFFLATYYLLEVIDEKFAESRRRIFKVAIPSIFLVMLFFNFWIDNEKT